MNRKKGPPCKICGKPGKAKGYCTAHYGALWQSNDPALGMAPKPPCLEPGCDGVNFCKGFCRSHYRKQYRLEAKIQSQADVRDSQIAAPSWLVSYIDERRAMGIPREGLDLGGLGCDFEEWEIIR